MSESDPEEPLDVEIGKRLSLWEAIVSSALRSLPGQIFFGKKTSSIRDATLQSIRHATFWWNHNVCRCWRTIITVRSNRFRCLDVLFRHSFFHKTQRNPQYHIPLHHNVRRGHVSGTVFQRGGVREKPHGLPAFAGDHHRGKQSLLLPGCSLPSLCFGKRASGILDTTSRSESSARRTPAFTTPHSSQSGH